MTTSFEIIARDVFGNKQEFNYDDVNNLWAAFSECIENYIELTDLMQRVSDITGALAEFDSEFEELDIAALVEANVTRALSTRNYPEFADDEEESSLGMLFDLRIEDFGEAPDLDGFDSPLRVLMHGLEVFTSYYAHGIETLVGLIAAFAAVQDEVLVQSGIDTGTMRDWLMEAEALLAKTAVPVSL